MSSLHTLVIELIGGIERGEREREREREITETCELSKEGNRKLIRSAPPFRTNWFVWNGNSVIYKTPSQAFNMQRSLPSGRRVPFENFETTHYRTTSTRAPERKGILHSKRYLYMLVGRSNINKGKVKYKFR